MTSTPLKMVMVYSDKHSAEMGEQVARNLRQSLGNEFHISQTSWNSELLRSPKLCHLAAEDAISSNIVIISTSEARTLPAELDKWVQLWRDKRPHGPAALVALLNRSDLVCHENDKVCNWLRRTAQRAHMDFFCHSNAESYIPHRNKTDTVTYADPGGKFKFSFLVGKKC